MQNLKLILTVSVVLGNDRGSRDEFCGSTALPTRWRIQWITW